MNFLKSFSATVLLAITNFSICVKAQNSEYNGISYYNNCGQAGEFSVATPDMGTLKPLAPSPSPQNNHTLITYVINNVDTINATVYIQTANCANPNCIGYPTISIMLRNKMAGESFVSIDTNGPSASDSTPMTIQFSGPPSDSQSCSRSAECIPGDTCTDDINRISCNKINLDVIIYLCPNLKS